MAKNIDDLDKHLEDILKVLQESAKAQGVTAPGSGGSKKAPKTLQDSFEQAIEKMDGKSIAKNPGLAKQFQSAGGLSGIGKSILGPAAPLVGVGVELAKLPGQIREFAQGLHDANRQFAQFSPAMAQVFAVSDMQDRLRKMQQGENLAASAGGLAGARGRLEDQLTPLDTQMQRLQNRFGEAVTGAMATFLEKSEYAKQLTEGLKQFTDFVFGEEPEPPPDKWIQELDKMVDREDRKRIERSMPVRNPPIVGGWRGGRDPRPDHRWDRVGNGGGGEF
jgi:uncharacterized phage infection (PIP) family protein YhgE